MGPSPIPRPARSIGACLVGDDVFTDSQLLAARGLIKAQGTHFDIPVPDKIFGHYEDPHADKTCPNIPMDAFRAYLVDQVDTAELQRATPAASAQAIVWPLESQTTAEQPPVDCTLQM